MELNTFILSLISLFLFYFLPGYFQIQTGEVLQGMSDPIYFEESFWFISKTLITFIIFFLFLYFKNKKRYKFSLSKLKNLPIKTSKSWQFFYLFLYLFGVFVLFNSVDVDKIINPTDRYSAVSPQGIIFSTSIFLFIYTKLITIKKKKIKDYLLIFVVLATYLIYPIATSSRLTVIPFVITLIHINNSSRNIFKLLPFLFLALLFLSSSITSRSDLGWGNFFSNLFSFEYFIFNLFAFVPGISTTSLALSIFTFRESLGVGTFLIYLLPIPSFLLPDVTRAINFQGSAFLGVAGPGINTDIISEWIFWFGNDGWFLGGLIFALIAYTPIWLLNNGYVRSYEERLLMQICTIYFFGAGYVMQIRSASRYFFYSLIFIFLLSFLRKKNSNFNLSKNK